MRLAIVSGSLLKKMGGLEERAWERMVLPTGSVFQKKLRVGKRVGQGFHSGLFQKQCGKDYIGHSTLVSPT